MYYKKIFIALAISTLSSLAMATTYYEDGKKASTSHWSVYDNTPSGAIIEAVEYNSEEKGLDTYYIRFTGDQRRNSYLNGARKSTKGWNNKVEKQIEWSMRFSEKFRISIYAETTKGLRIFQYDYKSKDKGLLRKRYIRIGLGQRAMNGNWEHFTRDLAMDLQKYDPNNKIISVNGFKLQGSGDIGYVRLAKSAEIEEDDPIVARAKDVCLNHKKDNNVICLDSYNLVYISIPQKLYAISSEGRWSILGTANLDKYLYTPEISEVSGTPLILLEASDGNAGNIFLYYADSAKKSLKKSLTVAERVPYRLAKLETLKENKELLIQLKDVNQEITFDELYDISDLNNIHIIKENNNSKVITYANAVCREGEANNMGALDVVCNNLYGQRNESFVLDKNAYKLFHIYNDRVDYSVDVEMFRREAKLIANSDEESHTVAYYDGKNYIFYMFDNGVKKVLTYPIKKDTTVTKVYIAQRNSDIWQIYLEYRDKEGKSYRDTYTSRFYTEPYKLESHKEI